MKIWKRKISWIVTFIRDTWNKCKHGLRKIKTMGRQIRVWHPKIINLVSLREASNQRTPPRTFTIKLLVFRVTKTNLPSRLTIRRSNRSREEHRCNSVIDIRANRLLELPPSQAKDTHLSRVPRRTNKKEFWMTKIEKIYCDSTICLLSNPSWNSQMRRLQVSTRLSRRLRKMTWKALLLGRQIKWKIPLKNASIRLT